MNGTIEQMLKLTADIAESLLVIKDADSTLTSDLVDKIEQLHRLAQEPAACTTTAQEPETAIADEQLSEPENAVEAIGSEAPDLTPAETEETGVAAEVISEDAPAAPETGGTHRYDSRMLREAMSLNDLFLFRRTLFGGSAERFNNALEAIAGMSRLSEVRDYLRNRSGINLKSPEAKDFISIMTPFFDEE